MAMFLLCIASLRALILPVTVAVLLAQLVAPLFWQVLVLLPALHQLAAFFRRQFPKPAISFARLLALLRRQLRPLTHTHLQALLFFGQHVGVTLSDAEPALATIGVDLIPFLRQWAKNFPLPGGQLRPRWCRLSQSDRRHRERQQQRRSYCCCSYEVCRSHASNPGSV